MELPDDVLQIIREYSKPWFKYHREYKLALAYNGRPFWKELRDCLIHRPECILQSLWDHETARLYLHRHRLFHYEDNVNYEYMVDELVRSSDAIWEIVNLL